MQHARHALMSSSTSLPYRYETVVYLFFRLKDEIGLPIPHFIH
jgi:hypothetical protein